MPPDIINQEILQRLTRVETKIDMMASAKDMAQEALQSSRSAHLRLDEYRDEIASIKQGQRWLIGTTVSVIALFMTAVGFLWKLIGGGS
jgi:hypothetical protein